MRKSRRLRAALHGVPRFIIQTDQPMSAEDVDSIRRAFRKAARSNQTAILSGAKIVKLR